MKKVFDGPLAEPLRRLGAPLLLATALATGAGCAPAAALPAGAPVPNPAATAAALVQATTPTAPRRATFGWELDEAGSRVRGRGVVRSEAPERLRLDLFGPRGETYLSAALVGDSVRVPPQAEGFSLPSPALLWGALGVVRPPTGARLDAVTAQDSRTTLRYTAPDGNVFQYGVEGDGEAAQLRRVERIARGGVVESLDLSWSAPRTLARARYRDLAAFRELILNFEETTDVPSFPDAIWNPAAPGG
jgi:hypothetical protein